MKIVLTQEEKENWVRADCNVGRSFAMDTLLDHPQYEKDTNLQELFNKLWNYDDFGGGDLYETQHWQDILDYLDLNDTYNNLWENLL